VTALIFSNTPFHQMTNAVMNDNCRPSGQQGSQCSRHVHQLPMKIVRKEACPKLHHSPQKLQQHAAAGGRDYEAAHSTLCLYGTGEPCISASGVCISVESGFFPTRNVCTCNNSVNALPAAHDHETHQHFECPIHSATIVRSIANSMPDVETNNYDEQLCTLQAGCMVMSSPAKLVT
jgi:hypothetical protein